MHSFWKGNGLNVSYVVENYIYKGMKMMLWEFRAKTLIQLTYPFSTVFWPNKLSELNGISYLETHCPYTLVQGNWLALESCYANFKFFLFKSFPGSSPISKKLTFKSKTKDSPYFK